LTRPFDPTLLPSLPISLPPSLQLPKLKALILYGGQALPTDLMFAHPGIKLYTFDDFLKLAEGVPEAKVSLPLSPLLIM